MSCNRHSVGALILTLAVSVAGLLLAYGATGTVLRRASTDLLVPPGPPAGQPGSGLDQRWTMPGSSSHV